MQQAFGSALIIFCHQQDILLLPCYACPILLLQDASPYACNLPYNADPLVLICFSLLLLAIYTQVLSGASGRVFLRMSM